VPGIDRKRGLRDGERDEPGAGPRLSLPRGERFRSSARRRRRTSACANRPAKSSSARWAREPELDAAPANRYLRRRWRV